MAAPSRVAFLVNFYPLLSEVFIMNAAAGLARSGVSVDIVPLFGLAERDGTRHEVEGELEACPLVRIRPPLFPWRPRRRALAAPAALKELVAARGWHGLRALSPLDFGSHALTLRPLMLARALSDVGSHHDVVHCHFATLAPAALALRRAGLLKGRVVVHFRGYDISQHVRAHGSDIYAEVFRDADWFIANCAWFRDRAIALGCDPRRTSIVTSGNDISRFPFHERSAPSQGPVRIIAVGRLVEKKGFAVAIEAVRRLVAGGLDIALEIVGDGSLRRTLEETIRSAGVGDRITLAGELPHHEIARKLLAAHIFVAPCVTASNGDQDAPVNTIKEAMATGAPVVATRHGGIPEIVRDGVNGILCAENDAADLAAALERLVRAPDTWAAMGRAGRHTIEAEHSLEVSTRRLLESYACALAGAREPKPEREQWQPSRA